MAWHRKYWDALDQLFWAPKYLGLKSIPPSKWDRASGRVSVPEDLVSAKGGLYSRDRSSVEVIDNLHGMEEVLNHVFDITFAIAPDAVIEAAFLKPLGFADAGPFQSLGSEVQTRYGWGASANVTRQDGFFVSERSLVAVELKLNTRSSPDQIAKYIGLLTWEALTSGHRANVGLLFIVPEKDRADHWRYCGLDGPAIRPEWLDTTAFAKPFPSELARLFAEQREAVNTVIGQMRLGVISWADVRDTLIDVRQRLIPRHPGDQTLDRLLQGFLEQLQSHRGALYS